MIMRLTSPIICLEYQNGVAYGCRVLTRILSNAQFFKSQSYNNLHFLAKKVLTNTCFQKQKGTDINVHYFYVTFLIFDVIGRLNTAENKINDFLM